MVDYNNCSVCCKPMNGKDCYLWKHETVVCDKCMIEFLEKEIRKAWGWKPGYDSDDPSPKSYAALAYVLINTDILHAFRSK